MMRNRIIICLECINYDYLKQCHTPNIDSLDPHPAISYGAITRAAVPAILGGLLPYCKLECKRWQVIRKWSNPFFLTHYHREGELLLYVPNGWVIEYLRHFMTNEFYQKWKYWHDHHEEQPTGMMVEDFLQRLDSIKRPYLAYFHCMETHPPFYPPGPFKEEKPGSPEWWDRRRRAVEYVDKAIAPLLKVNCDDLVIIADHNIGYGKPLSEKYLEVFMAARIRGV